MKTLPLKVEDGFLKVDSMPQWRIDMNRNIDKVSYKIFRTKCKVGLIKNNIIARLKH